MQTTKRLVHFCLILVSSAAVALAQSTSADIIGSVHDAAEAIVPNVAVRVVEEKTNLTRETRTNQDGLYEFRILPPGTYTLSAEAAGFKKFSSEHIPLSARQVLRMDIRMDVGNVTESVTVTASAPVIVTETGTVAGSRETRFLVEGPQGTPIMARFGSNTTKFSLYVRGPGTGAMTGGGARSGQWEQSVDGNALETQFNGVPYQALSEERETVTGASAEYRAPVTVDGVTKQGTNAPHGSVTFSLSHSRLNALGPLAASSRRLAQTPSHVWNLTGGGPLYIPKVYDGRNRTFLFASAERNPPSDRVGLGTLTVPTSAMRQGDFAGYFVTAGRPGFVLRDPYSNQPFAGNVIPRSRWSPAAVRAIDKYYPAPNVAGVNPDVPFRNAEAELASKATIHQLFARLDQKITDRNTAGFSFSQRPEKSEFSGTNGTLPAGLNTVSYKGKQFNWHDVHIVTPRIVNEVRVSYSIADSDRFGNGPFTAGDFTDALGIDMGPDAALRKKYRQAPNLNITGYDRIGSVYAQDTRTIRWTQIRDNISIQYGRHTFKMGWDQRFKRDDRGTANAAIAPTYSFTGLFTGYSLADFFLGLPESTQKFTPSTDLRQRYTEFGAFIQDDFKVNTRLTFNLGLRADRLSPRREEGGAQYNFNPATGGLVVRDAQARALANPAFPKSIPIETASEAGYPTNLMNAVFRLNPRFGFSYRLDNSGKTVVRGAYGTYTIDAGWLNNNFRLLFSSGPFALAETYVNTLTNGVPLVTLERPFPSATGRTSSFNVSGANPNLGEPVMHQWNLTVERQVYGNWGVRISYVGAANKQVWYRRDLNRPAASLTPFTNARLIYPAFQVVTYIDKGGNDAYHAFQAGFTHRYSNGLTLLGAFQWVNQLSDVYDRSFEETTFGQLIENPYCRSCERHKVSSVDSLDFRTNFIYDMPFGRGRRFGADVNRIVNGFVGNWTISGIVDMRNGRPDTVTFQGRDTSNTNLRTGRADVLPNCDLRPSDGKSGPYLNIACFAVPQNGTFGNATNSVFRRPSSWDFSGSLYKYFPLFLEGTKLRINAVFTNAFNHPTWDAVGNNISDPTSFGKLQTPGAAGRYIGAARSIVLQAQVQW